MSYPCCILELDVSASADLAGACSRLYLTFPVSALSCTYSVEVPEMAWALVPELRVANNLTSMAGGASEGTEDLI